MVMKTLREIIGRIIPVAQGESPEAKSRLSIWRYEKGRRISPAQINYAYYLT
jgi:hypothetical protein